MHGEVQERCIDILKKSDALFAYLDSPYSYGSIAEIAYASALGIECTVIANFGGEDDDSEWAEGTMSDAYWFVAHFPGVHGYSVGTEEHATELFTRFLGFVLAESPVEHQLWKSMLGLYQFPYTLPLPVSQYAINGYRLDLAWPDQKVAVEVDGHDYHKTKEQRSYDAKRDRELMKMGWTTLRFTGSDVYQDADAVAIEVLAFVKQQEAA
jgi:very-short-patch-repair endonuclease